MTVLNYRSTLLRWRNAAGHDATGVTQCGGKTFRWGKRTYVMGILNMSPDSFSGDGLSNVENAVTQAKRFVSEGADIIDIGGESTKPDSKPVTIKEELDRIIPVLEKLCGKLGVPISVDTYKVEVANRALDCGADMINDIWGLKHDMALAPLAAERKVPIILMSNQRQKPEKRIIPAVITDLKRAINVALKGGISWENIIIDPGIGFGKTLEQNLELVRRLDELKILGRPILLGASRKSMIGLTLNLPEHQREEGTAAACAIGIAKGADIIRVHDVLKMKRVAQMSDAIIRESTK
jgi:dihydropteroate synthase